FLLPSGSLSPLSLPPSPSLPPPPFPLFFFFSPFPSLPPFFPPSFSSPFPSLFFFSSFPSFPSLFSPSPFFSLFLSSSLLPSPSSLLP
ncbi:hypothetical protein ACXWRS_10415, partial [Streptococcus pyogenes]